MIVAFHIVILLIDGIYTNSLQSNVILITHSIKLYQLLQFTNLIRQCGQLVVTQIQVLEFLEVFNVWR